MKQKIGFQQTLKQTFKISLKMLNSLDFLKVSNLEMNALISQALQTNPFLEPKDINKIDESSFIENFSATPSLQDDLYKQLYGIKQPYNPNILSYLIESLNEKGFLSDSLETTMKELNINKSTLVQHLEILQSLEPIGVGAQDTFDSICIQLKHLNKMKSYELMKKYKDILLTQNYHLIEKKTKLKRKEIDALFQDIKQCNPFPCSQYSNPTEYVIPDIEISVDHEVIHIEPINQPTIVLNDSLYEAVKQNETMKRYFEEAQFVLENLTRRNQTVLMIANELVKIQQGYFLYDDELVPCTLADLQEKCGFHSSTISRTLNNKYYSFHNEVYPLKKLMVSKTTSGDSSDSIKKAIELLIEQEDKHNPLSDEVIMSKLEELDLICSRRTIAKYRQQLSIPSSSKRKIK